MRRAGHITCSTGGMHWFHGVGDMRWLIVFWVASFLIMWGAFYLFTRPGKPKLSRPRRGSTPSPYEPTPRPSA